MRFEVVHPEFQRQRLSVFTSDLPLVAPVLLLNGDIVKPTKSQYTLLNDVGVPVTVRLKWNMFDPIPVVMVRNERIQLARGLTLFEYVWIALPMMMMLVGGALGGGIGSVAAILNARVMRSDKPATIRFALSALITVGSFAVFLLGALLLQPLLAPRRH
jgi:hypothetical protein